MKRMIIIVMCLTVLAAVKAQQENGLIREGNKFYKKHEFTKAVPAFQQAVKQNPSNGLASYNLGNGQFRLGNFEEAANRYDSAAAHAPGPALKEKAYYNKGVAFTKQKKLPESIGAYEQALLVDPSDSDARFNLQKALIEKKQQEQQQQQPRQEQPKKQQQQKQQQQQSKLSKQKVEQLLKALQQKEQEVQQRMQQNKTRAASQQDKDW